jgi:hypothetical protein
MKQALDVQDDFLEPGHSCPPCVQELKRGRGFEVSRRSKPVAVGRRLCSSKVLPPQRKFTPSTCGMGTSGHLYPLYLLYPQRDGPSCLSLSFRWQPKIPDPGEFLRHYKFGFDGRFSCSLKPLLLSLGQVFRIFPRLGSFRYASVISAPYR